MVRPRLFPALLVALMALIATPAAFGADAPAPAGASQARPRKKPAVAKRKKQKTPKSDGADESSSGRGKMMAQKPTRTLRPDAIRVLGEGDFHEINADAQVTPFPSQASAVKKAFAANRRDQLKDAETSARLADEKDRWQTVLFHLRELDSRTDGEACFWRVISFYRLGELARARRIRDSCTLSTKDESSLDAEDALSVSLQPVSALPELAAGEAPPAPVPNPAPYAGPAPARFERY
jgi:hypothetical protein